ncbi:CidA/LrgA family protein, partial [Kingella kingae]|uniref:CidA/LrgA family protein n=1 Tax=Kingella kingae TaxID=504 RepID=UPI0032B603D3
MCHLRHTLFIPKSKIWTKSAGCFSHISYYSREIIMICSLSIILGCLALGELIIYLTHIKLPSGIIGLLILFGLLQGKWVKPCLLYTSPSP